MQSNIEKPKNKIKPIIFWYGFPVCALLLKKVADEFGDDLIIVGTKTEFPFPEIEDVLGHKIVWLKDADDIWERREEFNDRNFIMHTGWVYPGWLKYDRYMKHKNNAKVVSMIDNRYRGDLRQHVGAIWFRVFLKKNFDAVLVPGKSGKELMEFFGMEENKIYTGLYGAYEGIFKDLSPIQNRNKEFLFVGQLIERKGIDILIPAFQKYRTEGGTWNLRIVGSGPLQDICHGDGIILEPFAAPDEISSKMNKAKVLVLPSRDDNWGTVVCEAAACGMNIISTQNTAAGADIVQNGVNGLILENIDIQNLVTAFFHYENLPVNAAIEGSRVSKEIAGRYGSESYYQTFLKIISDLS